MREFQLFRYLKKWMPFIILFFIVMTAGSYYFLSSSQQYSASAVIRYSNVDAVNGLAPDGSSIDTSEINSASNMAKAMENLGLSESSYSVDALRSSISVTPIVNEEDTAVQAALNEQGEKRQEEPTEYIVTCTLSEGVPGAESDLSRRILNELLDVYFSDYSEKHINRGQISNAAKGIQVDEYDYLDVTNQIADLLDDTIQTMADYNDRAMKFRAASTGYSFGDLRMDFELLRNVNVYRLYSLILGNRLTKDNNLLISKYLDQTSRCGLTESKAREDLGEIEKVIEAYVQKMRTSDNTYNDREYDYNYILDQVYDDWHYEEGGDTGETRVYKDVDHTVEYDTLLENWVDASNDVDFAVIDSDYCRFILDAFGYGEQTEPENAQPAAGAKQTENKGAAAENAAAEIGDYADVSYEVVSSAATAEEIEEEIDVLMERLNELFDIADRTNAEYNEYLGAQNIQTLSSVTAGAKYNMKMYMMIIAVVFLIIGCGVAIILGRLGDILEYLFLRDRQTGCMNRVACDNFINEKAKSSVESGFCCVNLQIRNQREINRDLGREEADKIMQTVGRILRDTFEGRDGSFIGYNGSGQFWAFFEIGASEDSIAPEMERLVTVINDQISGYPVAYSLGGVNARELGAYNIRTLISKTVAQRSDYVTSAAPPAETAAPVGTA